MGILKGVPDWQGAIIRDGYTILPVFQGIRQNIFLPKTLSLALTQQKMPDFHMDFVCPQGIEDPTSSLYTMISMGLTKDALFAKASEQLKQSEPQTTLFTANFDPMAFWNLETAAVAPVVSSFAWENQSVARIYQRLPEHVGNLVYLGLGQGTLIARSAVQCEFPSVLQRIPARVEFVEGQLLEGLAPYLNAERVISLGQINTYFGRAIESLPLELYTQTNEGMHFFSTIMTGLVCKFYGTTVAATSISQGPCISLKQSRHPDQKVLWDLSDIHLVSLPLMLSFDPFTEVQDILKSQDISVFTSFTSVPPLPSSQLTKQIYIDTVLPPKIQDSPIVFVELRVDAELSFSGSAELGSLQLFPPSTTSPVVEFKFQDPNATTYHYQLQIITPTCRILGTKNTDDQSYLFLSDPIFEESFVTVRCTSQLLQQVELALTVHGAPSFAGNTYTLNQQQDALSLFLPKEKREGVTFAFLAFSSQWPNDTQLLEMPAGQIQLDLFSFPEFQTQTVLVEVAFVSNATQAIFEFLPQGENQKITALRFTPQESEQSFVYSPTQLLQTRYCYRCQKADGSGPTPWSAAIEPNNPLSLQV